ncbi:MULTISPECIES: multi antimicrobial extrusion protein MatE [Paenibacillus]|uniref:Multi antimicrobial extrusion protein MatE n=1 Tax=Paenibacillus taichungensis TaxID=484184 RepID=A0ABX2MKE9_9BACL|nr:MULTISPECIES: multi antimicrobial extrusion protein MatE [Paenibacillus]MDR9744863.1 multi antimicrobial extrusion protein MatE [Paenibacillus taichungensis]NUU54523.1 multi antimicrobial extrusion protein MatE [Paenibacillus taichungensis]OME76556.1 multi antimicrobial extrusion protein MatE [Paenibacillus pabuli]PIH61444.1 multi antimicrobial extrusion protein MatE [Paenibacillus sp. LK1]
MTSSEPLSWRRLFAFFVPLGISASLVTISHVIINSTLARSAHPETVIASYAIAGSLLTLTERPSTLLRQTCSALVRDRLSFQALTFVTKIFLACVLLIGFLIVYSPIGTGVFKYLFGVSPDLLSKVIDVYEILMYVSIFSVIRNIYQGIIITNNRTKWLTIGMLFRLAGMYGLSLYFIYTDSIDSGRVGAIIFAAGMMIEALVSFLEGNSIKRKMPAKLEDHPVENKADVFRFYKPLLLSSFVALFIGPVINIVLGKTTGIALAISSFAVASSLMQLMLSFFTYIHQIVLNFYLVDAKLVKKFALVTGFVPFAMTVSIAYTPLGPWVLENVMSVQGNLLQQSLWTLRAFVLFPLISPFLDFSNGLILLRGQTKTMFRSQTANAICTVIVLLILVSIFPAWNGMIGAVAQSLGLLAELVIVWLVIRRTQKEPSMSVHSSGKSSSLKG